MGKRINWIGSQFNGLKVLALAERRGAKRVFLCACECGNFVKVYDCGLSQGTSKSCGCRQRKQAAEQMTKHGLYGCVHEYNSWIGIKQRCLNPKNHAYPRYGGRGISICSEWVNDFAAFYSHIGPRPGAGYSVDRINNNGNYEPGNVRWATRSEQSKNRRPFTVNGKTVEFRGETVTIRQLSRLLGINPSTLYKRLDNGWTPEDLAAAPAQKFNTRRRAALSGAQDSHRSLAKSEEDHDTPSSSSFPLPPPATDPSS